ncbi:hypothetical protein CHGG_10993 [Chaetomium globosum CBS 148.51]|uniref:MYND-type domain-containing protein n=1 Tax=Chaetomium globosum (strain ATCC 6205 / CBS 148.51 / DSM 1962 / NBRC 6347 / NRRL 1970) TaxID=306901 RepID=Q2GM11_CHAGB|nr:uncharacterized protein CHGG_10993 [Chaetomium globosum CBS 148.51]EAQ83175.1 hypothetical protein CHGG_10993 [Chaetomium globosum CBS 148.51]
MEEHFPSMIRKQCEVCKKTDGLSRCGGCYTYYYCGREHQTSDRPTHKTTCNTIKGTKTRLDEEEAKILARSAGDDELPANAMELGRLWLFQSARPYLRALYEHGEMLVRSWRQQGIEDALAVYLKLLRLNTSDNQAARHLIPALYIRLGRNQEAYDFVKGWGLQFRGRPEAKDLEPNQGYPHVKDADATEEVELWTGGRFLDLSFVSSLQLIKVRLLLGLQHLLQARAGLPEGAPMPSAREVLAEVRGKYGEDILDRMPEVFADEASIVKKQGELNEQLKELFTAVDKYNKHFWPMMLQPEERDFTTGSQMYTHGSREEAHLAFSQTYSAWCETPMAIGMIRAAVSAAAT